jgi:hypothetical protein
MDYSSPHNCENSLCAWYTQILNNTFYGLERHYTNVSGITSRIPHTFWSRKTLHKQPTNLSLSLTKIKGVYK